VQILKGDKIVFNASQAGFGGYNGLIRRSVVNVLKSGMPCCSVSGFNQPIPVASIRRVLPKQEWRDFDGR